MVEVAPDPLAVAGAASARPSPARRRQHDWRGLVVGGTVVAAIGAGLLLGGAFGLQHQRAANADAAAQCMAEQDWFCGAFDGLSEAPYGALIGMGAIGTLGGVVLVGLGVNARGGDER